MLPDKIRDDIKDAHISLFEHKIWEFDHLFIVEVYARQIVCWELYIPETFVCIQQ